MGGFNKIMLVGILTRDPKLMHTSSGLSVCDFGLVVYEKAKAKSITLKIDVTCFDKTAESCAEHLTQGRWVLVEGKLSEEEWTNRKGEDHRRMKVKASCVNFLDTSTRGGADKEA